MPRQAKRDTDREAPAFLGSMAGNADTGVRMEGDGPVRHYAAASLARPLEFPASNLRKLIPILLIAIAASIALIVAYNATVMADVQRNQEMVSQAIARDVSLDLPVLKDYAGKTNEQMMKSFETAGYAIYDNSNEEDKNVDGFDAFKLASDADAEKAARAYSTGIENLKDVDAAWYLAGSWRFIVSRVDNPEIRLRYADFASTDPQTAIEAALQAQGFDDADLASIGVDTQGNTNISGTFKKEKTTYEYTISACDLVHVYDIEGVPDGAQFVGIRVTVAE